MSDPDTATGIKAKEIKDARRERGYLASERATQACNERCNALCAATDDELLVTVAAILARPGDEFTSAELDELYAIQDELKRRDEAEGSEREDV